MPRKAEEDRSETAVADPNSLAATLSLSDGVGFLVRVLGSRATAVYEQLTGQGEVTPQQFGVLLTLHQRGALTLTELAEAVCLDRSTLGEMTRRMSAKGLVHRRSNGADRRSTKATISADGKAALLRLIEGAATLQEVLLAPVPPRDRRLFLQHLKRVALASDVPLERPDAVGAGDGCRI